MTPLPGPIWATPGIHQVAARHAGEAPAIPGRGGEGRLGERGDHAGCARWRLPWPPRLPASGPVPEAALVPKIAPDFGVQTAPPSSDVSEGWWLGRKWAWVAAGSTVLLAVGAITAGTLMDSKFAEVVFPHPTVSEALREAILQVR